MNEGNDIPARDRITMPPDEDVFSDEQAQAIVEGRVMPTPEALVGFPKAFNAMLLRIKSLDQKQRMRYVPAVEAYLKELDMLLSANDVGAGMVRRLIQKATFPAALTAASGEVLLSQGISLVTMLTFAAVYYGGMKMREGVNKVREEQRLPLKVMERNLLAALRE